MSTEIPIWVNGTIRWVSGVDKKTTCKDVVEVLLVGEGIDKNEVKDFTIMERWRRVERPLDENSKILKVWSHWGDEKKEVRLCLKRIDNEVDSGRGSPVGTGNTPSLRRKRHHRSRANGKPPWNHHETLHPRRLAELGRFTKEDYEEYQTRKSKHADSSDSKIYNDEPVYESRQKIYGRKHDADCRKKSKSYHCSNTGLLHSTLLSDHQNTELYSKPTTSKCCSKRTTKPKIRNSENIEKLMKLILAQGATIQNQLQKLKEREEQIENMEHEKHKERVEKNGRNYLLETYLGSLGEAEIPNEADEKGNDSGVHTEGGSDQINMEKDKKERLRDKETENRQSSRKGRLKEQKEEKGKRSKSESRTPEGAVTDECNSLKRAKSENELARNCENPKNESARIDSKTECSGHSKNSETQLLRTGDAPKTAKEDVDDTVELRRIQSQVEMWEKVLKINKKLEKEEENLVRLHIKIKRFQSENMKIAKDSEPEVEVECKTMQKNLETLRGDLDQNSKEIYQNFTKLIENDEVAEQKRNYLTKLMSDIERTEHEHNMLNEMVTITEEQSDQLVTSFCEEPEEIGISLQVKGQEKIPMCQTPLSSQTEPITQRNLTDEINQRAEPETDQIKPKTVKISFDDQISEDCQSKEPPATPGTIKGILKNRNNEKLMDKCNLNIQIHHFQKCTVGYGSNIDEPRDKLPEQNQTGNRYHYPQDGGTDGMYNIYSYPVNEAYTNPIYGENPNYHNQSPIPINKNIYSTTKIQHPGIHRVNGTVFQNGSVVTTKAMIHNDTDSSTSSDTSGLSSMYSSSPTVEEPYTESSYVLDTLV